jgi:hypothetical protein
MERASGEPFKTKETAVGESPHCFAKPFDRCHDWQKIYLGIQMGMHPQQVSR